MSITYADSGVNRVEREKAKKFDCFELPEGSVKIPFNVLLPLTPEKYYMLTADGVGTKVLLAQLARKFDTIGVDGVAMVVNDAVRCGAKPVSMVDIIDIAKTEQKILAELMKGVADGARQAECRVVGGETADVPTLVKGVSVNPFQMNFACYAEIEKKNVIDGKKVKPGDKIIGLRSSGVHSNGISLVRRALFKEWGGKYDAFEKVDGLNQEIIFEALKPTKIYVKEVLGCAKRFDVKAVVHVTGDAYGKFSKLFDYSNVGYSFDNFKPQTIFSLIQETGEVSIEEMFKTFNMGWGMAVMVGREEVEGVLQLLNKTVESEVIGEATKEKKIAITYKMEKFNIM